MNTDAQPSRLENLPTEIVEHIAECICAVPANQASDPNARDFKKCMASFRATSKTIEVKTHRVFVRTCFRERRVKFTPAGLAKFHSFSKVPELAHAVRNVSFLRDETPLAVWDSLMKRRMRAVTENDEESKSILMEKIRAIVYDKWDQSYLETSGTGTSMLAMALSSCPNIKQITIHPEDLSNPSFRYKAEDLHGPGSSTILATSILAAVALAGLSLRTISMSSIAFQQLDGIAANRLYFPAPYHATFSKLEHLVLNCRHCAKLEDNLDLANFLLNLPTLRCLHLGFDTFTTAFSALDGYLLYDQKLSMLQELCLEGVRFSIPNSGSKFLVQHANTLHTLSIRNCDIDSEGFEYLPDQLKDPASPFFKWDPETACWMFVLETLRGFKGLKSLDLFQLAENMCRICYLTLGVVGQEEISEQTHLLDLEETAGEVEDVLEEEGYVFIGRPNGYHVVVEEWEDMSTKLQLIQDDFHLSEKGIESDIQGTFLWQLV